MSPSRKSVFVLSAVVAAALTACGGGGGGGSAPAAQAPAVPTLAAQSSAGGVLQYGQLNLSITLNGSNVTGCTVTGPSNYSSSVTPTGSVSIPIQTSVAGQQNFTVSCASAVAGQSAPAPVVIPVTVTADALISVPDPVLRAALALQIPVGTVTANMVRTSDALRVTQLSIANDATSNPTAYGPHGYSTGGTQWVTDVTGLSSFVNLTSLKIENQKVSSLDVSALTNLTTLSVWGEPLTTLDVSHNVQLQTLGTSETSLSTVDTSALPALTEIDAQNLSAPGYTLTNGTVVHGQTFNLTNNTHLSRFHADYNALTSLDLSHNHELTELWVANNNLTTVNVAGYSSLNYIVLTGNNLAGTLDVTGTANSGVPYRLYVDSNPSLTALKVNSVAAVTPLFAAGNQGYFKDSTCSLTQ